MKDDRPPADHRPRPLGRVVLCNIGRVGDTILRNSILDSVVRTYAEVTCICGPGNLEVVRAEPRIRRAVLFRNSPAGLYRLLVAVLRGRYDGYIDLKDHDSSISLMLARIFRCSNKTGVNRPRSRPFHHDTRDTWVPGLHKLEVMKLIARRAGLVMGEFRPTLVVSADSIAWFRSRHSWQEPYLLLNVSATHPSRIWPAEKWIAYLRGCDFPRWPLLVNGLPADQAAVNHICSELPGATALRPRHFMDVAAALADARLVLSVNTGVTHACSALDKTQVALFNPGAELAEFGPVSSRQIILQPPPGRTLPDLDPSDAIAATRQQLDGLPAVAWLATPPGLPTS